MRSMVSQWGGQVRRDKKKKTRVVFVVPWRGDCKGGDNHRQKFRLGREKKCETKIAGGWGGVGPTIRHVG